MWTREVNTRETGLIWMRQRWWTAVSRRPTGLPKPLTQLEGLLGTLAKRVQGNFQMPARLPAPQRAAPFWRPWLPVKEAARKQPKWSQALPAGRWLQPKVPVLKLLQQVPPAPSARVLRPKA